MPKSLEETVMFTNEDEGFQELSDRLLAYSSTKQSIQMSESKRPTRKDDQMDVDALSKGSGKGKSKGKGKKGKDQNHMSNVKCWNCGKSGHCGRDCREMWWSGDQGKGKSKSKGKGKLNNAESSNWQEGWLEGEPQSHREQDEVHVDGWWKTTDWQTGSSSGWWMTANDQTPWETEEPIGGFEINSTEGCCSKGPRRGREQDRKRTDSLESGERFYVKEAKEQRTRRWQNKPRLRAESAWQREEGARVQGEISSGGAVLSSSATVEMNAQTKKRQTVISPEQTDVRIVLPPEVSHDTRICIEDLVDIEIDQMREEREVQGESVDVRHAKLMHRNRGNAQAKPSAVTWVREKSKSEACAASCSHSNRAFNLTGEYPVTRPLMEETMRSTLSSPKQARESTFHARSSSNLVHSGG